MLGYAAKHLRHPVFRPLFELFASQGHQPHLCTSDQFVTTPIDAADIVLLKTYHFDQRVIAKAKEFEAAGKRVINPTRAIQSVADRVNTDEMLEQACIPVPPRVCTALDLTRVRSPFVRKPRNNFLHNVSFIPSSSQVTFDPAFYYQHVVPNDGLDYKLYVIDRNIFLVTRPSNSVQDFEKKLREKRQNLTPPDTWRRWALKIGELTGLQVYGIDLVGIGESFYIIDVNPFPGFIGVPNAHVYLAQFIMG